VKKSTMMGIGCRFKNVRENTERRTTNACRSELCPIESLLRLTRQAGVLPKIGFIREV
jgi:hypothetical protein